MNTFRTASKGWRLAFLIEAIAFLASVYVCTSAWLIAAGSPVELDGGSDAADNALALGSTLVVVVMLGILTFTARRYLQQSRT